MTDPQDKICERTSTAKQVNWNSWREPMMILIAEVTKWLEQLDYSLMTNEVSKADILSHRRVYLVHALGNTLIESKLGPSNKFMSSYVYETSIWADAFNIVFEYIGENEHQFGLNTDEFASNRQELLEDFSMYARYWRTSEETS